LDIGFYLVSNPTAHGFVKASAAPFNLTFLLGTSHQPTPAIPPKIVSPHRQASHWRLLREQLSPAGTCDVSGVMLHLGPVASQQAGSLPGCSLLEYPLPCIGRWNFELVCAGDLD
jgi:hypothetical protein